MLYCVVFFVLFFSIPLFDGVLLVGLLVCFAVGFVYFALLSWPSWGLQPLMVVSAISSYDSFSFWLLFVTVFVIITSVFLHYPLVVNSRESLALIFSVFFLFLSCVVVFMSDSLFMLYLAYELSLLPITYIIVKWGHYSDRSISALYIVLYTTFFTFPLISVMVYFYFCGSFSIFSLGLQGCLVPVWVSVLLLFSFLVKFPIYGLHYWLPIAHVEAPTFGSIVLAGLLLKLGGYALLRVLPFTFWFTGVDALVVYLMLALLAATVSTAVQSDFNRLVAYSSVVHMTSISFVALFSTPASLKVLLMVIVIHGVLSPMMFLLVSVTFYLNNTRLLLISRGLLLLSPLVVGFISTLVFLSNIPTPPFPQFLAEVVLFVSFMGYSWWVVPVLVIYTFLSIVYNLSWFISVVVSPSSSNFPLSLPIYIDILLLGVYSMFLGFILFFVSLFW